MQVSLHPASSILGCGNIRTRQRLPNLRQPALRITLNALQSESVRCSSKLPLPFPRGWASPICSFLAAVLCLVSSGCAEAGHQILEGPARVIDGDTLEVAGQRVRLFGLDAPEKAQSCSDQDGNPYACGLRSKEALEAKLRGAAVLCEVKGRDLYGRNVSRCSVDGKADIGQWLVSNGYAIAYRQYSKAYVDDEAVAQHHGDGIWKGSFEEPADWRREHRNGSANVMHPPSSTPASKDSSLASRVRMWTRLNIGGSQGAHSPDCNIKGNISKRGQIMFLPTDKGYDSVKIDTKAGEKWFCNILEAEQAGWRRTKA